jgi:hypothetical protein
MQVEDQKIDLRPAEIPQEHIDSLSRPLVDKVRKAFENPEFASEFEKWLSKRKSKKLTV